MVASADSYVCFALTGDDFEPAEIIACLGIEPTKAWKKGDTSRYNSCLKFACWKLETEKGKEPLLMDILVAEVIAKLEDKIDDSIKRKQQFKLHAVLEIVLFVDINEECSTPALGHDLRTINFLYRTQTRTDVDIYRYNSHTG